MKSNDEYWHGVLNRYRLSKAIRGLRRKMGLWEIAKKTDRTKQYVYGIQEMTIKPNKDFINKLESLND
jgi:hypothetical protein